MKTTTKRNPAPRDTRRRETPERAQRGHEVADADRSLPASYYRVRMDQIERDERIERTSQLEAEVRQQLAEEDRRSPRR